MSLITLIKRKKELESFSKKKSSRYSKIEFLRIIHTIIKNDTVKQMKNYRHHCDTSCFKHCLHVAYYTYVICKKLKLDYISGARAAMLHDLFLYDWRKEYRDVELDGLHAFVHPQIALRNSMKLFDLNEKEQDIILKHMWPVTIQFPKYRESYVVTFMDKYSAVRESYLYFQSNMKKKTFYRYAYVFLSLILFRIV